MTASCCPVAVIAYLELLNALALEGAVGEVLPVDLNKNRNLGLFSDGKAPDINSNPELAVKDSSKLVYRSLAAGRPQWRWLEGAGPS